jgi:hypothetical protein
MDIFSLAVKITEQGADALIHKLGLVEKKGHETEMELEHVSHSMKHVFEAIGAALVLEGFAKTIEAAGAAQQSITELQGAVENTGASYKDWQPILDESLEHLSRHTRFGLVEGRTALGNLMTATGSASKAYDLLGITADVASKRHIDLADAARLVGKIANGNNAGFRQLGLTVHQGADGMAILRERFGGFAEKEGKNVLGQLKIMKNEFEEVLVAIGGAILGTDSLNGVGDTLITWLQSAEKWITANKSEIQDFTSVLVDVGKIVGTVLVKALYVLWAAFKGGQVVIIEVWAAILEFPDVFKRALGESIRQFADFLKNMTLLSDRLFGTHLTEKWVDALDNFGTAMSRNATRSLGETERAAKETIDNLFAASKAADEAVGEAKRPKYGGRGNVIDDPKAREAAEKKAKEAHDKLVAAEIELVGHEETRGAVLDLLLLREGALSEAIRRGIPDIIARSEAEAELTKIRKALTDAGQDMSSVTMRQDKAFAAAMPPKDALKDLFGLPTAAELNRQIQVEADEITLNPLVDEFDLGMQSLAATALASVDDAFKSIGPGIASTISAAVGGAFTGGLKGAGKAILAGLGAILGQMGDAMISAGLVMTGLLPALMNPFTSGPALIAAGVVLVGLGALLGAIATRGKGGAHGGSRGGGSSFGAGLPDTIRLTMGPTSAGDASTLTPRTATPITVIGEDDARAQRAIIGLIDKAGRRNIRG